VVLRWNDLHRETLQVCSTPASKATSGALSVAKDAFKSLIRAAAALNRSSTPMGESGVSTADDDSHHLSEFAPLSRILRSTSGSTQTSGVDGLKGCAAPLAMTA
jgi:hypothetical protein